MGPIVRESPWNWVALVVALMMTAGVRAERYATSENDVKPPTTASGPAASMPVAAVRDMPEQVVVLQDGGVMRGRVTRNGDRYVLTRETGETYIPSTKVLLVARSLEEAYQQRRQQLGRPTSDGHLALAEWCLRQDLLAQAELELAEARALDPRHDKLALLERRHSLARERQNRSANLVARAATESHPVSFPTQPAYTDVGELPPGAVERFTRRVQPVLVNSCTTAGCHELGGTAKFQLDRAMLRGMSNRRTTMNNLSATLELVDRDQPRLSPLLTVPRHSHGGMKDPVLGPRREAAFRHLEEWVTLVTAETAKPSPAAPPDGNVEGNPSALLNEFAAEALSAEGGLQIPVRASELTEGFRKTTEPISRTLALGSDPAGEPDASAFRLMPPESPISGHPHLTPPAPSLRYGARLEHWQPRDPFDPEIFNRKYVARATASVNSQTTTSVRKSER